MLDLLHLDTVLLISLPDYFLGLLLAANQAAGPVQGMVVTAAPGDDDVLDRIVLPIPVPPFDVGTTESEPIWRQSTNLTLAEGPMLHQEAHQLT